MGKLVLIAEDEPYIVESISFLLEQEGYGVKTISDGVNVLDEVHRTAPDMLILDVMLPGQDGYQILKRLRADTRSAGLPVLMLTAKGQKEDRETALALGADRFMTKPFANADIIAAVRELTESGGG